MTRQPICDDNGKIIGSFDPDFQSNLPDVLYRLDLYECETCNTGFLVDHRWVTTLRKDKQPTLNCPVCGEPCECEASTSDEMSDELEDWGCAYPNGLTWDEERKWKEEHPEVETP